MEGTLLCKEYRLDDGRVAPSAWTLLAEKLGSDCLAEENLTKTKWTSGGYDSYMHWMRETVEIHRRFGLSRALFDSVVASVGFMPMADAALSRIHERGAITALITGGFKALADRVQQRFRIHHAFAACEYFFSEETGLIDHFNLLPADEFGKVDFMNLLCREYGVAREECAFVGDGMNDVHLAQQVGFSVAFNAQPQLRAVSSVTVDQQIGAEDFLAVAIALDEWSSHRNSNS